MNISMDINVNTILIQAIEEQSRNQFLEEIGKDVIVNVMLKVPVDTGNLLENTGFNVIGDGELEFYANTPYAEIIDKKTHFMEEVEFYDYEGALAEKVRGLTK